MKNSTWLFVFSLVALLLFVPAAPVVLYFTVQEKRSGEQDGLLQAAFVLSILGTAVFVFFLIVIGIVLLSSPDASVAALGN